MQRNKFGSLVHAIYRNQLKIKVLKLIEANTKVKSNLCDLRYDQKNKWQSKINWISSKFKNVVLHRISSRQWKQPMELEKKFANHTSDKGFVFGIKNL
jgi:hypothetical protein